MNGPLITLAEIEQIDRERILRAANEYLSQPPITVTAASSPRSKGGKHDYFSEGDYWWPDPKNPSGPYIRRDGYSNPQNFNDHREALIRLSLIVPALTAAWLITQEKRYAEHAAVHLRAWFIDPATRMNPSLDYAQAVWGVSPGRGTGIIDTLHLVEVTRAARHLDGAKVMTPEESTGMRDWFTQYMLWMVASKNGQEEEAAKNNHGTCWVAQVAAFCDLTGNAELTAYCRNRFQTVLIPHQEAPDGSFPEELRRTKPYGYSLFNLDALGIVAQLLGLWKWQTPDGRGMARAMEYMYPYMLDKKKWPLPPDVMYDNAWPVRQPCLLFAGLALAKPEYLALWRKLDPDPTVEEVIRNFPLRQPLLW